MLKGLEQSVLAIDLIDNGEFEKSMELLRNSHDNCNKILFFNPDKIVSAIHKCSRDNPNAMFVSIPLLPSNLSNKIEYVKRCLCLHSRESDVYYILSGLYGSNGEFEKGLEAITKALELNPNETRWIYSKASHLRRILPSDNKIGRVKQIDKAIESYQDYLDKNPNDDSHVPEALYTMAFLCSLKQDVEMCRKYLNKAEEMQKFRLSCFEPVDKNLMVKQLAETFLNSKSDTNNKMTNACRVCFVKSPRFKCECLKEKYCSRACQLAHWPTHKLSCNKRIRRVQK